MVAKYEKRGRGAFGWISHAFALLLGIAIGIAIALWNAEPKTEWGEISYELLLVASEAPLTDELQKGSGVLLGGEHPNVQSTRTWRIVDNPTLVTSSRVAEVYGTLCAGPDGGQRPIGKTHLIIHVVPKAVEQRVSTEIRISYERQKNLYRLDLGNQETRAIKILSPGPGRSEYCYLFVTAKPIAIAEARLRGTLWTIPPDSKQK